MVALLVDRDETDAEMEARMLRDARQRYLRGGRNGLDLAGFEAAVAYALTRPERERLFFVNARPPALEMV